MGWSPLWMPAVAGAFQEDGADAGRAKSVRIAMSGRPDSVRGVGRLLQHGHARRARRISGVAASAQRSGAPAARSASATQRPPWPSAAWTPMRASPRRRPAVRRGRGRRASGAARRRQPAVGHAGLLVPDQCDTAPRAGSAPVPMPPRRVDWFTLRAWRAGTSVAAPCPPSKFNLQRRLHDDTIPRPPPVRLPMRTLSRTALAWRSPRRSPPAARPRSCRGRRHRPVAEAAAAHRALIPTVHIAPAKGWPAGAKPMAAAGTTVTAFATGLDHPRWLYVLPNGDVLVAETNAPPKPEDGKGIKGWVMKQVMKKAGAGRAEREPHHAAARCRRRRRRGDAHGLPREPELAVRHGAGRQRPLRRQHRRAACASPTRRAQTAHRRPRRPRSSTCPAGRSTITGRRTSSRAATARKLYVTVGSNSNVAENGMDEEEGPRGDLGSRPDRPARTASSPSGLRNPNGLAWEPRTGALWTVVNERDELGSDLVPDYLTSVKDGGFYGWPYSYFGQHVDERVKPQRPDLVAKAIVPDYALGAHVASLGLVVRAGNALPAALRERHVRRPARFVEPQAAERLQGGLRAVRGGKPAGAAGRRADRLRQRRRRGLRPPGRRRDRQARRRCWWPTTSAT